MHQLHVVVSWWKKGSWCCFGGIQLPFPWLLLALLKGSVVFGSFWYISLCNFSKHNLFIRLKPHSWAISASTLESTSWTAESSRRLPPSSSSPLPRLRLQMTSPPWSRGSPSLSLFLSLPPQRTGSSPSTQASPSSSGSLPGWGPEPRPSSSSFDPTTSPSGSLRLQKPSFSWRCRRILTYTLLFIQYCALLYISSLPLPPPSVLSCMKGGRICGKLLTYPIFSGPFMDFWGLIMRILAYFEVFGTCTVSLLSDHLFLLQLWMCFIVIG